MNVLDWARDAAGTARFQQLKSILNLRPPSKSLEDYVLCWTFLPLEFSRRAEMMVNAPPKSSTTGSYKALSELVARFDMGLITFDPAWLQNDLDYLTTLLLGKSASDRVQGAFLDFNLTKKLFKMDILEENQAAILIQRQIEMFLEPVVESTFNGHIDLDIQVQPRHLGPGQSTVIAQISFSDDSPSAKSNMDLVKGVYKVPRVLTNLVLLWILYLARQAPDPDMRGNMSSAEKVARLVLNQIFVQQAVSSGTRSYLSNGRHYLFAKVGADRTKMILSSIYNPNGTIDPYNGTVHPDKWTSESVQLHAIRLNELGHAQPHALLAIVVSSLRDRQDRSALPALTDDSDSGSEHGDDEDGDSEDNGANGRDAGESDTRNGPDEDPPENNGTAGERRSGRLDDQARTQGHQVLPANANEFQLTPLTFLMSDQRTGAQSTGFAHRLPDPPYHALFTPDLSNSRPHSSPHSSPKFISKGTLADVFAGSLSLSQRTVIAAFKVMSTSTFAAKHWCRPQDRPFTEEQALGAFNTEASLLIRVNSQSLGLVPLFFGMWKGQDPHGYQHRLMGMELLGKEAHPNMSLNDKEQVVACLAKLHSLGLTHGDVALRHFKRRQTGQTSPWALIDLERSKEQAETDVDFKVARQEMAELRSLLEL